MTLPNLTIAQMLECGGPGGAETVLLQLSEELLKRGHRIVPVRGQDGETWLDNQLRDRSLEPQYLPMRRAVDPAAVGSLAAILKKHSVDVVHSHEFTMAVYGAAATKKIAIPHVITMHGNLQTTEALRRRIALRWAYRTSHAVVAVSRATQAHLRKRLGRRAGEILTIPNGIPVRPGNPAGPRSEFGISNGEILILAVGNLYPGKAHIVLLRALARLSSEGCATPWRLIIAGRGGELPALETFAAQAGIQDRVHLAGHRDDIPDLQAAADVLCMPSLWEGLPLAVLEGMHAGNCIVASRTSGIPEAITDGENGLLVPPGDEGALAMALRRVLEDPALRSQLGAAGLATATERFHIKRMADRYEQLYRTGI